MLVCSVATSACGSAPPTDASTADDDESGEEDGDSDAVSDDDDDTAQSADDSAATPRLDAGRSTGRDASHNTETSSGDAGPKRASTQDDDAGAPAVDEASGVGESGPAPTADSTTKNGPYPVKTYTSGYRDGPRYADSTIHYPDGAAGALPAVSVVPGFVSPQSSIKAWGPFLASHGIITMTIGTNSTSDQPPARADALLDALETIRSENTRSGGPLNGKVDTTRLGVMGWSMGGGGTLIAASRTPTLKAAISMCGWNIGASFGSNKVPTLMFAATADPLAGGMSQGFYRSIPNDTPKLLFEVAGGSHNVANSPRSLSGRIGTFGLSWLKVHLVGDSRYKQFLVTKPAGLATFQSNLM